ncbi:FAD-binding oxidoreductase [Marivita sp. GX14005]|uniref:FAD-binding oxidoreductase n=1 Tax=Marivita sp. GX14005 TaxID=2942276 RepID=UPI002019A0BD|nr:FAD-binding oxidoreductase [Marivita sp. GX14005]MCL3881727.1 FAD-binding oxidoreductase [Marivita sp. GX14005]
MTPSVALSGWGRFPTCWTRLAAPRGPTDVKAELSPGGVIARGGGRAYGDSAIGSSRTLDMGRMNRMLAFDYETGTLVAEAGVRLSEIIDVFLPRGFFPFVTPGTKFVSLGGAIAADVHGKNHHKDGSFGAFVEWIDVMGADGEVTRAGPRDNGALFEWTLGGMGLTGIILRAAIRLRPVETAWIKQQTLVAPDLDAALDAFERADEATYSVAWIDCLASGKELGRSLILLGEHASAEDLPPEQRAHPFRTAPRRKRTVPFDAPRFTLNRHTVRAFNAAYWRNGSKREGEALVDWDSYFYPLDAILGWNRIYGRRGFVQFQCVLPLDRARDGLERLLLETSQAGQGSFLAVLKRLGPERGGLSFPMSGYTLALDFPVNRRALALIERLESIAIEHGGRFYLAKDALLGARSLHEADPRAGLFRQMRSERGMNGVFGSRQSDRLLL